MTSNTTAFIWTPALMLTSPRIRLTAWPLQLETFTPRFLNKPWSHLDNNRYPLSDSRIIIRRRGEGRGRGEKSLQDLHVALQASGDAQTGLRWRGGRLSVLFSVSHRYSPPCALKEPCTTMRVLFLLDFLKPHTHSSCIRESGFPVSQGGGGRN